MTAPTTSLTRAARVAAAALLAAGLVWASAAPAGAASDTNDSDVAVSVPAVDPGTNPPPPPPGTNPPPPAPGGGGGGRGGGAGGGGGGGGGTPPAGGGGEVCVPKEPAMPQAPATGGGDAVLDQAVYVPGETVTATAAGFGAAEQVQLVLFGDPVLLGTFTADAAGTVTAQFPVAEQTLAGTHTLQFTGWCGAVSTADILVGSVAGTAASTGIQLPPWLWWIAAALAAVLLIVGGRRVIIAMRAPAAPAAAA